jgi:7-cyano-7-deazaguanine synthase
VDRHVVLPLDLRQFGGSALTDAIDVPKDGVGPDIPVTYVPATLFSLLALAWAEAAGSKDLFIGVNALDYSGYPDCRPEFVAGFEGLARIATKFGSEGGTVRVHAPLQYLTKAGIAREAVRLRLDTAKAGPATIPARWNRLRPVRQLSPAAGWICRSGTGGRHEVWRILKPRRKAKKPPDRTL